MGEIKFEKVSAYEYVDFDLPERKTKHSAGYDFMLPEDVVIPSIFKQWFKMAKARTSSPEFLRALAESEMLKDINTKGVEKVQASPEEQKEYLQGLIKYSPEMMNLLQETFTLSLGEMKALTKEANAKATLVPTGVKAKFKDNQRLELMIRSSTPFHSMLVMGNGIGLIDADYYNNEDNEGHIFFQIINLSPFDIKLEKGDIIGQGVLSEYQTTTDDAADGERSGGIGSTSE